MGGPYVPVYQPQPVPFPQPQDIGKVVTGNPTPDQQIKKQAPSFPTPCPTPSSLPPQLDTYLNEVNCDPELRKACEAVLKATSNPNSGSDNRIILGCLIGNSSKLSELLPNPNRQELLKLSLAP